MDLTLNNRSSIHHNEYGVCFGVRNGAVTMRGGSSITDNVPNGGLHVAEGATIVGVVWGPGAGANVRDSTSYDCEIE